MSFRQARLSKWFRRGLQATKSQRKESGPALLFRSLESRRVLSVTSSFVGGLLEISYSDSLDPAEDTAALLVDTDPLKFFVDEDQDGVFSVGETQGLLSDLQQIRVQLNTDTPAPYGNFFWFGDFSAANNLGTAGNPAIDIQGIHQVNLGATFQSHGDVVLDQLSGTVVLGGESQYAGMSFDGDFQVLGNLQVATNGQIVSHQNAQLVVTGDLIVQSGGPIALGTSINDSLDIGGLVSLTSGAIHSRQDISIGLDSSLTGNPSIHLGTIDARGASIAIHESDAMMVQHIDADHLLLTSAGNLLSSSNASIHVEGDARFDALGEITLATSAGSVLRIDGSAEFHAQSGPSVFNIHIGNTNAATIHDPEVYLGSFSAYGDEIELYESDSTLLDSVNAEGLSVQAHDSIVDRISSSIEVTGRSFFISQDLNLGNGAFDTGTLQFEVQAAVIIHEDSDTVLAGSNQAAILRLATNGNLTDQAGTLVQITGDAQLIANGNIRVANDDADRWNVDGTAHFRAGDPNANLGDTIEIGNAATAIANFGSIGLYGSSVALFEDSATHLQASGFIDPISGNFQSESFASIANRLSITTTDRLSQADPIQVSANAGSGLSGDLVAIVQTPQGEVRLDRSTSSNQLIDNRIEGSIEVISTVNDMGDVRIRDISTGPTRSVDVAASNLIVPESVSNLELLFPSRSVDFSHPSLSVTNELLVVVGLDGNPLSNTLVSADRTVTDSGTSSIVVFGQANLHASGEIRLADLANESLDLKSDAGFFAGYQAGPSFIRQDITLGSPGMGEAKFGSLAVVGDVVTIVESNATEIYSAFANSLELRSAGGITDRAGTTIDVASNANFTSQGDIVLADTSAGIASDTLRVGGTVTFTAIASRDTQGNQTLADIAVGIPGTVSNGAPFVELGQVAALGRDIVLFESDSTRIVDIVSATQVDTIGRVIDPAGSLSIASAGDITNFDLMLPGVAGRVVADQANLFAGTWIVLDNSTISRLTAHVGANLDPLAVDSAALEGRRNGQAILVSQEVLSGLDAAFTVESRKSVSIDGITYDALQDRFDFEATHEGRYALLIRNQGPLQVDHIDAVGNGLNLYIETIESQSPTALPSLQDNLTIAGSIRFIDGATQPSLGGIVLIADDDLIFGRNGELLAGNFGIFESELRSEAFDGGNGIGPVLTTELVVPARGIVQDPLLQSKLQRIAVTYGATNGPQSEFGFDHVVGYADGNFQTFGGGVLNTATGNGVAVHLEREIPFENQFLSSIGGLELPTAVLFRRADGVFMYEQAGRVDIASVVAFLPTSNVEEVSDVYAGVVPATIPVPPTPASLPLEPVLQPLPFTLISQPRAVEFNNDVEVKLIQEDNFQIVIASLTWEDLDVNANRLLDKPEYQQLLLRWVDDAAAFLQRMDVVTTLPIPLAFPENATDEQLRDFVRDLQQNPAKYFIAGEGEMPDQRIFQDEVYGIIRRGTDGEQKVLMIFVPDADTALMDNAGATDGDTDENEQVLPNEPNVDSGASLPAASDWSHLRNLGIASAVGSLVVGIAVKEVEDRKTQSPAKSGRVHFDRLSRWKRLKSR